MYLCIEAKSARICREAWVVEAQDIGISVITAAELRFGAANSRHPVINQGIIDTFLRPFTVEHFSEEAALEYGHICAHLRKKGTPIGPFDALIAAHALSKNVILVSNNLKEFSRVPKLRFENWIA